MVRCIPLSLFFVRAWAHEDEQNVVYQRVGPHIVLPRFLPRYRDPGCISSKKRGTAPTDVGTEYDLVTVFKGKESNMLYKVTKWEKPDEVGENKKGLVQLFGKGPTATGLDTISFESVSGNATKLTYTADIQLTGIYWFFTPLVRADIMQLGDAAIHGLAKHYGM